MAKPIKKAIQQKIAKPSIILILIDSVNFGITSTYVENTLSVAFFLSAIQDHLHIRGEYSSQHMLNNT